MPLKYRLTRPRRPIDLPGQPRPTAVVWVESEDYDADGPIHVESDDPRLTEQVREALFNSYGNRARPIDGDVSPRDLACALDGRFLKAFEPVEI